jgi:hypothetical protein
VSFFYHLTVGFVSLPVGNDGCIWLRLSPEISLQAAHKMLILR